MTKPTREEVQLINFLLDPKLGDDLEEFVRCVYPWGKANTPLERFSGPRAWQRKVLRRITRFIKTQADRQLIELPPDILQLATAAGRGIGKSALLGMICHWMMTTRPGATIIISANTKPQLETVTFPEISKWFSLAINSHWFETLATQIRPQEWLAEALKTARNIDSRYYYVNGKLWSEENPHAFAGPHSQTAMMIVFDEASGIPKSIADVARFYFTDLHPNRYWLVFSNPRANSGFFYDCFHDDAEKSFWETDQIDARDVEDVDTKLLDKVVKQYGLDHDMTRVEVLGQFPKQGANQFISNEVVQGAIEREVIYDPGAPLHMGIDVARYGDDKTCVRFRQGPDARSIPPQTWGYCDLYTTADRVAVLIDEYKPDTVAIDHGMGAGVIDILRRKKYLVYEVHFGSSAEDDQYADKRTEMYGNIAAWLPGGAIDDSRTLKADLVAPTYSFVGKDRDKKRLEPKEELKKRLGRSPDDGDALALTFAVKASRRDRPTSRSSRHRGGLAANIDYPLFG